MALNSEIIIAASNNNCFVDQALPFAKEGNTWSGTVGKKIQVQGWYVSESGESPKTVYATLALKSDPSINFLLKGMSNQSRNDVGEYFGNAKFSLSGFDLKSDSEITTPGQYQLTILGKIGEVTISCLGREDFIIKN